MATERLTKMALVQHDQGYTKGQQAKGKAGSQANEEHTSVRAHPRLLSHSDSRKSLLGGPPDSSHQLQRQNSRSSTGTLTARGPGLSLFRVVQAARAWKRLSERKQTFQEKPKTIFENTYRLGPEADQVFRPVKVEHTINEVLALFLNDFVYSPEESKRMCLSISSELKSRVKKTIFPRYKVVSHVVIVQNRGQGMDIASRCVWTPDTDSFASCTLRTSQIICVANVYAVYNE